MWVSFYNPSSTYSKGEIVTYYSSAATYITLGLRLYKCKTAITEPEAWTSSHWDEVNIKQLLATKIGSTDVTLNGSFRTNPSYGDTGYYRISMGEFSYANGECAVAIGNSNVARGDFSLALGNDCDAFNKNSTSIGYKCVCGSNSDADYNEDKYNVAIGKSCVSRQDSSYCFGESCSAYGGVAVGIQSTSNHAKSVAVGIKAQTMHENSVAIGNGVLLCNTCGTNQIVMGSGINTLDADASTQAFIFGIGLTRQTRKNGMKLDWDGNLQILGTIRSEGVYVTKDTAIAPEYDSTDTYAVNDIVTYQGLLYKCNTAILTAEDWDSTHWTETTVMAEIKRLLNS